MDTFKTFVAILAMSIVFIGAAYWGFTTQMDKWNTCRSTDHSIPTCVMWLN